MGGEYPFGDPLLSVTPDAFFGKRILALVSREECPFFQL
jgi:hypothetical protein